MTACDICLGCNRQELPEFKPLIFCNYINSNIDNNEYSKLIEAMKRINKK